MRAERVLFVVTGILIGVAFLLCWGAANTPQTYNGSGTDSGIPWPIVWGQIAFTMASVFGLVGIASAAGLLFLRAVRWTSPEEFDEEAKPEPSP